MPHVPPRRLPSPEERVAAAVERVRSAPTIVQGLRRVDDLVTAVARDTDPQPATLLEAVAGRADALTAIAAVHGLGALPPDLAQPLLLDVLESGEDHLREHAVWALASGPPAAPAVPRLVDLVAAGGFAGMLAQRTLEAWAPTEESRVRDALASALARHTDTAVRTRLAETLGLVPGSPTTALLVELAADAHEAGSVRAAAVAALGDDPLGADLRVIEVLDALADAAGPLADTARTALHDLSATLPVAPEEAAPAGQARPPGHCVVQLFLHADIDAGLTQAGRGDNGGIATLLVQLGDALVRQGRSTTRVVTVSRGRPADAASGLAALRLPGHHYASVPLWGPPVHLSQAWPLRVAARRGIRRILRAAQPDVVHLRMADVGSMAAAEAADELGIPVVLTLAPDPHALVDAREAAGTLTREGFGEADHREHLVFRDHLLRGLADRAAHLVLFPRAALHEDLGQLLGVDLADPAVRASVVAEGVDLDGIARAGVAVARASAPGAEDGGDPTPPALLDLDALLEGLTPQRRALPLALTVGRLHPVKGMATLVEAWATDRRLRERCNLLVVGGDLESPSDEEAAQLARIHAAVPQEEARGQGLLLAGHRPNAVVAAWMAATRRGRPGLAAAHGVYVSASLKEEFGIAILEAMAAGLVVVAPAGGGPPTYVEEDVTGVLVDTSDPHTLADAVGRALALAGDPAATARADDARVLVRERFGIGTMAEALDDVYERVAAAPPLRSSGRGVPPGLADVPEAVRS